MYREKDSNHQLGAMIKELLKKHSMSMRKLSEHTGINVATISRIISAKQPARLEHLQKFSDVFHAPIKDFFEAAGYNMADQNVDSDVQSFHEIIQETLELSNLIDEQHIIKQIKQKLAEYEVYALTAEGQTTIQEKFLDKAKQIDGIGPYIEHLMGMYSRISNNDATERERAIIGSVLLYFILSTDIIPDYTFPIGYLDDAIAIKLGLNQLALLEN